MRLTDEEAAAIRAAAIEIFGLGATVRLFGSRLDDDRRGGDIDLHVQTNADVRSVELPARFRHLLDERLGERDYDILIANHGSPDRAIDRKAIAEGIIL